MHRKVLAAALIAVTGVALTAATWSPAAPTPVAPAMATTAQDGANQTTVVIASGLPADLGYRVPVAGNVSFVARLTSGAIVTDLTASGIGLCDGRVDLGVHITGVGIYNGPSGHLKDCGVLAKGLHTLHLETAGGAGIWTLWIDGAAWA